MKPRILVAEDNEQIRDILVDQLTAQGWDVESAPDGQEAIDKLLQWDFDAVSTDFEMPRAHGLKVTQAALITKSKPEVFMFSGTDSAAPLFLDLGGKQFFDKTKIPEYLNFLKAKLAEIEATMCGCSDCEEEDCFCNCSDEPCRGCRDSAADEKDREFEFAKAQGRI